MTKVLRLPVGLLICAFVVGGAIAAEESDAPSWADDLRLTFHGVAPPGRVTISINGEFAAEFDRDPPSMTDIGDLVREGQNVITVVVEGDADRATGSGRNVRLAIAPARKVSASRLEIGRPLVEVTLPPDVPADFRCSQDIRFWAGPELEPAVDLKEAYWLVFHGPPTHHLVAAKVNGKVLFEAMEGDMFFNITEHVVKGKNEIEYEARRTCLARPTDQDDPLRVFVTTGDEKTEVVEMSGLPEALFVIEPDEKKDEIVRRSAFRAR